MLCVTMNDIPGWEIQRVCGEVFGVTVRSRNAFSQIGAGFKSMVGGELGGMTKNVIDSRNEAMTRLFAEAQARGGNALVAMRFDTTELGNNWSEICAYGTAVVAVPVTEAARQTAIQLGYGQPGAQQQPAQGWGNQPGPQGPQSWGQGAPGPRGMPGAPAHHGTPAQPGVPQQDYQPQGVPGQDYPPQDYPQGAPGQRGTAPQHGTPAQPGVPQQDYQPQGVPGQHGAAPQHDVPQQDYPQQDYPPQPAEQQWSEPTQQWSQPTTQQSGTQEPPAEQPPNHG